jgi:hypothetical protein
MIKSRRVFNIRSIDFDSYGNSYVETDYMCDSSNGNYGYFLPGDLTVIDDNIYQVTRTQINSRGYQELMLGCTVPCKLNELKIHHIGSQKVSSISNGD